jgi:predicted MFS family arabinose efflux permease
MMRDDTLRLALAGLIAMAAALGIGRFVYTPILPAMVEALSLSKSQAGLIASANFLGYLAGALLAALPWLAPRRGTLIAALAVNAAALAAMGLTTDLYLHLALRLIGGVASAFVLVLASAMVLARLNAAGRSGLSALHFGGVGLGIAASSGVVAALGAAGAGWGDLWLASGILSLLALAAVAALMPDTRGAPAAAKTGAANGSPASLMALIAAYGLFGFGYVITATFIVAIVRGAPEIRPLEPYIWMVVGLAGAPSVAIWLRVAKGAGAKVHGAKGVAAKGVAVKGLGVLNAFALACIVEAAGVLASILWVSAAGILIAAVFLGGTFMAITALGLMAARDLAPASADRSIAWMTAAFGAGQIVGPSFAGLLFDRTGSFFMPSLAAAGALIVAAGLSLYAAAHRGRDAAPFSDLPRRQPGPGE